MKLSRLRRRFELGITPLGGLENERAIPAEGKSSWIGFPFFI